MLVPACREIFLRPPIVPHHYRAHFSTLCVYREADSRVFTVIITFTHTCTLSLFLCVLLAAYYVLPSNKSFLRWGGTFPLLRDISEEEGWGLGGGYGGLHLHLPAPPLFQVFTELGRRPRWEADGRTGFHAAALMKDCGWCCEESYTVHAALAQLLLGSSSGVSAFFNSFIAV